MKAEYRALVLLAMALLVAGGRAEAAGYAADPRALVAKAEPWPANISIAHTAPVTRENYLQTAEVFVASTKSTAEYYAKQPKPYPNLGFNVGNASWLAAYYALKGDEQYAELAVKCLEHAYRLVVEPQEDKGNTAPGWLTIVDLWFIEQWLGKSPAYGAEQKKWVREICLKAAPSFPENAVEYGAFNRAFHAAITGEALLKLIPDAPDAEKWREYKEKIWDYWWRFRDNDESTDHYCGLWFRYLLQWVEMRGNGEEFWKDAGVKRMMERYMYQVFPMGAFPHYSDSCGWNVSWGHWIWIFEECAAHYQDGRYKWAAHRLYDYGSNRIEKLTSWSYTGEEAAWSLFRAYLIADEKVAEKSREYEVALLQRHKAVQRPEAERIATRQFIDLFPEMVPDKLVFYGGSDPGAMAMMVDVVGEAGHSHGRRPTVLALADRGSVLLMSLGYMERRAEDHNIPLLADYEGFPYDATPYHIKNNNNLMKEASCSELGNAGYGRVVVDNYQGYPATLVRDLVFVKNAGVVIKDTIAVREDLRMRWSPLWRARFVGPDYGANWINTYVGEWVPLRGLGRNAPVYTRWHNSPRDLMIYFAADPTGTLEVVDESGTDTTSPMPLRVQYTLRQNLKANQPVSGLTVLVPHNPGPAATLAAAVRVLANDALKTVVEFQDGEGVKSLVVLNGLGGALKVGGLETDGRVACVRHVAGKVSSVGLLGGKKLMFAGKDVAKQAPAAKANVVPGGE